MILNNREKWPVGAQLAPLLTVMQPVVDPPLRGKDHQKADGGNRDDDQCPVALVQSAINDGRSQNSQACHGEPKPLPRHDLRANTSVVGDRSDKDQRRRKGNGSNDAHQNEVLNLFVSHVTSPSWAGWSTSRPRASMIHLAR